MQPIRLDVWHQRAVHKSHLRGAYTSLTYEGRTQVSLTVVSVEGHAVQEDVRYRGVCCRVARAVAHPVDAGGQVWQLWGGGKE